MSNDRKHITIHQTLAAGVALLGVLFILGKCTGCFEHPAQLAAAAGYEAQQMRCIEQYADRASIDRCRDRVKLAWTIDNLLDAGTEGGDR